MPWGRLNVIPRKKNGIFEKQGKARGGRVERGWTLAQGTRGGRVARPHGGGGLRHAEFIASPYQRCLPRRGL